MWLLFACVDRALFHRTRPGGTFVSAFLTSNFQQASAVLPTDTTAPCSRVCPVVWQHSVFSCHNFLSHRVYDIILSIVSDFGVKHVTLRVPGQVCGQLVTCNWCGVIQRMMCDHTTTALCTSNVLCLCVALVGTVLLQHKTLGQCCVLPCQHLTLTSQVLSFQQSPLAPCTGLQASCLLLTICSPTHPSLEQMSDDIQ